MKDRAEVVGPYRRSRRSRKLRKDQEAFAMALALRHHEIGQEWRDDAFAFQRLVWAEQWAEIELIAERVGLRDAMWERIRWLLGEEEA